MITGGSGSRGRHPFGCVGDDLEPEWIPIDLWSGLDAFSNVGGRETASAGAITVGMLNH